MNKEFDKEVRVVPFRYTMEQFQADVVKAMSENNVLPVDVFRKAEKRCIRQLYYPIRVFEGDYTARWSAQEGHTDERLVVRSHTKDSLWDAIEAFGSTDGADFGKTTSYVTSEEKTNWHHISGVHEGHFSELFIANDDNQGIASKVKTLFTTYSVDDVKRLEVFSESVERVPENTDYLRPSLRAESSWTLKISNAVDDLAKRELELQFEGISIRHLSMNVSKTSTSYLVYLPVWVFGFIYQGEEYCLFMDDNVKKLEGHMPSDDILKQEVSGAESLEGCGCLLFIMAVMIIGGVIYACQTNNSVGYIAAAIGAVLFVCILITKRMYKARQKELTKRIAERATRRKAEARYLFAEYICEEQKETFNSQAACDRFSLPKEGKIEGGISTDIIHTATVSTELNAASEQKRDTHVIHDCCIRVLLLSSIAAVVYALSNSGEDTFVNLILGTIIVVAYLFPAILAFCLKHPRRWAIFAVNFVLGWTGVGWLTALVWCFIGRK